MNKDLITGANSGFIGGHLAKKLRRLKSRIKLFRQDEWEQLDDKLNHFSPNRIFHLASYGNHYYQKDFKKTLDVNIIKTSNLHEASKNLELDAFIILGSSSEYGKKNAPMKETDLLEPDTVYGATKVAATLLSQVWAKNNQEPIVIIRPFSIFGPHEADHRFIPTTIRSCLLGEPMSLDPNSVHDWLFVSDLIDGILLLASKARDLKGQIINLGSGIQTTNAEVVEIIEKICGKKANIKKSGMHRVYDNTSWVADISKARALGWQPKISLFEGLIETVKHYKKSIYLKK